MSVKKSDSILLFDDQAPAKITKMGHITDLTVCDTVTCEPVCKRLSKDYYLNTNFNPPSPRGERPVLVIPGNASGGFQSTLPARGET